MKKSVITSQALNVLDSSVIDKRADNYFLLHLPKDEQLARPLYLEVNKVLETFGGKWNKKVKAHVFTTDPVPLIEDALLTGSFERLDKNGYFPTPKALADEMAGMFTKDFYKRVGEFSFGSGNLIRAFAAKKSFTTLIGCEPFDNLYNEQVEKFIDAPFFTHLQLFRQTFEYLYQEFISATHATRFDAVILNPPFERGQDASHIRMAIDLLAPQGELVAIASAGLLFRKDKRYSELREFLEKNGGIVTQLPEGTFKESGTNVNTVLIYYKNTEEIMTQKKHNEDTSETVVETPTTTTTTKTTKNRKTVTQVPNAPETNAGISGEVDTDETVVAETVNAEIPTTEPNDTALPELPEAERVDSAMVYTVNKTDGVISETTRSETVKALDGKHSSETVNKLLDNGKVIPNGEDFYSADRKKLVKFEKQASDAPKGKKQPKAPVAPETPSEPSESAKKEPLTAVFDDGNLVKGENESNEDFLKRVGEKAYDQVQKEIADGTYKQDAPATDLQYEIEPEAPSFELGDQVIDETKSEPRYGTVVTKNNQMLVSFTVDGKTKTGALNVNWRKMTNEEIEAQKAATALAVPEKPIQGIAELPDLPLTDEERAEEQRRRFDILEAKQLHEKAELIIADNVSVVRDKKLWRESLNAQGEKCKSFKEYVVDVLGFADKYGQNLAQIGDYRHEVKELTGESLDVSINSNNALIRGANKIAEAMGLGEVEFSAIRPIINASLAVVNELVTDEQGNVDTSLITPRIIAAASEKIIENVRSGVVEIGGESMTVDEAKAKGVLDTAFRESVMQQASESILVNKAVIKDEIQKDKTEREKPVLKNGNPSASVDEYTGKLPNLQIKCAKDGDTTVISIGNGVMQTKCGCRWRIHATTAKLVPYEVAGLRVKAN